MKKFFAIVGITINALLAAQNCFASSMETTSGYITCFDVMFVYARGSGGDPGLTAEFHDISYAAYTLQNVYNIRTRVADLDYPAVAIDTPQRIYQTYVSAGKSYSFGNSVKIGVSNLRLYYRAAHAKCPDMKFGFIGYSQGATVLAEAAKYFDRDAVLFIMMLGDPSTYLPEGEGLFPSACFGGKKSSWRTYVPNCRTSSGIFGQRKPYEAAHLAGKYSLWCNRNDYICGSSKNPFKNSGHVEYSGLGLISVGIPLLMKKSGYEVKKPPLRASAVDNWLDEIEDDGGGLNVAAPKIEVYRENDMAYLKWEPVAGAEDLLVRLNGIDLGYIDASSGELEIRDIDPNEEFRLDLAWMDKDGELSEFAEAAEEPIEEFSPVSVEPQAVQVSGADGQKSNVGELPLAHVSVAESVEKRSEKSDAAIALPAVLSKSNGWEIMPEEDFVWIAVSMAAASGLLVLLFVKWRH